MSSALLGGLVLGLVIAAGPGPIALLTARRTLTGGWGLGFASGLGVATADAAYATLAVLGVGALTAFLGEFHRVFEIVGGATLIGLGLLSLRARGVPLRTVEAPAPGTYLAAYVSILALTISNPSTILSFAAVAAGFNLRLGSASALFVAGVFLGSGLWWLLLTLSINSFRRRLTGRMVRTLATASALFFILFGATAAWRGFTGA